jgi:hypothetical protein
MVPNRGWQDTCVRFGPATRAIYGLHFVLWLALLLCWIIDFGAQPKTTEVRGLNLYWTRTASELIAIFVRWLIIEPTWAKPSMGRGIQV